MGAILGTLFGVAVGGLTPVGQPSFWLVHVARQEGRVDHAVRHHLESLARSDWKTEAFVDLDGPMKTEKARADLIAREEKNHAKTVDIHAEVNEITYRRAVVTLDDTIVHRQAGCQRLRHTTYTLRRYGGLMAFGGHWRIVAKSVKSPPENRGSCLSGERLLATYEDDVPPTEIADTQSSRQIAGAATAIVSDKPPLLDGERNTIWRDDPAEPGAWFTLLLARPMNIVRVDLTVGEGSSKDVESRFRDSERAERVEVSAGNGQPDAPGAAGVHRWTVNLDPNSAKEQNLRREFGTVTWLRFAFDGSTTPCRVPGVTVSGVRLWRTNEKKPEPPAVRRLRDAQPLGVDAPVAQACNPPAASEASDEGR